MVYMKCGQGMRPVWVFDTAQALGYGTFGAGGFFGDSEKAALQPTSCKL